MAPVISVVIPTRNAAATLPQCLAALRTGAVDALVGDIVVADAGSSDATREIAEAAGARVLTVLGGRGPQLAAACAAASQSWLLALHADTVLQPGWKGAAIDHMDLRPDCAGWFRLRFDDASMKAELWSGGANLRAGWGLPYGDQGLLISRALYDEMGGYKPLPLMEDVDLVRRLGRRRLAPVAAEAVCDASQYRTQGWFRRSARNWRLLARYFTGADPGELAQRYD